METWNDDLLSTLFDDDTVNAILSIPLSTTWPGDKLFWWMNKNGIYSVKSGYWLGLLGHNHEDSNTDAATVRKCWSTIWSIPGPPKLRHFVWRACHGSLATKSVLFQRYCVPSAGCDQCNGGVESIMHALVDCPKVNPMWSTHSACVLIESAPRDSFSEMLCWIYNHAQREELLSIYTTLWAAWSFRNNKFLKTVRLNSYG